MRNRPSRPPRWPAGSGPAAPADRQLLRRLFERRARETVDNSSTHSTPDVKIWLSAHRRAHLHFTPTSASWMTLVESWFGILPRKSVRRGSFDSVAQLVRHIEAFFLHWNGNPTPFIWTKPASELLKRVRRSN